MIRVSSMMFVGIASALASASAAADEHVINTKVTAFDPAVVFVKPGDIVKWPNMAGHNTESIAGMIPEGAEAWQSQLGEAFTHTFDKEGAYVYKCAPHLSQGMLGVVVVGDAKPANLDAIKTHPENKGMIARSVRILEKELKAKGL